MLQHFFLKSKCHNPLVSFVKNKGLIILKETININLQQYILNILNNESWQQCSEISLSALIYYFGTTSVILKSIHKRNITWILWRHPFLSANYFTFFSFYFPKPLKMWGFCLPNVLPLSSRHHRNRKPLFRRLFLFIPETTWKSSICRIPWFFLVSNSLKNENTVLQMLNEVQK